MTKRIATIKIGKRYRKKLGDVQALADDVAEIGLLQPIVVNTKGILVAGRRRIEAFKLLGRKTIPTHVVDLDAIARGEYSENAMRKDFIVSERHAIGEALKPIEMAAAKGRQQQAGKVHGRGQKASVKFTEPKTQRETASRVAKSVGMSRPTYEKAGEVIEAAKAEPKKYGKFKEEMDKTGKISGVHRRMRVAQQIEQIEAELPPMPSGPFRVIVVDPPWTYDARAADASHRAANPYACMTTDDIRGYAATWPRGFRHKDSILWLWTTNAHLPEAFSVVDAWGFQYKTMLTWTKDKMGLGNWLRGKTEHCLMAVRGKPTPCLTNQTTSLIAKGGKHSAKPDAFYAMVEKLCPGAKVELFARKKRKGWTTHGAEII